MGKRVRICIICSLILLISFTACQRNVSKGFILENFAAFDAKLYGDYIVTGTNDDGLLFLDMKGNIVKNYPDIHVNWLGVCQEDGMVVYGNFQNQTGICRFDKDLNLIENTVWLETETLAIDQSLVKTPKGYYSTITKIEGTVNNKDPKQENGNYSVELYFSSDGRFWEYVSTILKDNHNSEDGDLKYSDGILYFVYERESVDQGNSQIMLKLSKDEGNDWSEPMELLPADSDHEMADFYIKENGFRLYYSCDIKKPGESYQGADNFYTDWDKSFNIVEKDVLIQSGIDGGKRLYVAQEDKNRKLLVAYAKNYLKENDLVLEVLPLSGVSCIDN